VQLFPCLYVYTLLILFPVPVTVPSSSERSDSPDLPTDFGVRPDTLSLSYPSAGGAAAAGATYIPKRISKRESYSSLSEYSSHSGSMNLLIAAASSTPLRAQGTVDVDGDMVTFVADGINDLIRRSRGSIYDLLLKLFDVS